MLKASKHETGFKMRSPLKGRWSYDVDRPHCTASNAKPSGTNCRDFVKASLIGDEYLLNDCISAVLHTCNLFR